VHLPVAADGSSTVRRTLSCVAVATGLLQIGSGWVSTGPALGHWPPGEADLLAGWLTALRVVCAQADSADVGRKGTGAGSLRGRARGW
jgi:hypothetical protein